MLTLPIKKKWFDMILSGEKKEEYREIKEYYETRFQNLFGALTVHSVSVFSDDEEYELLQGKSVIKQIRKNSVQEVVFRNGYSKNSKSIKARCRLRIGKGRPEWGASPDKQYYILEILDKEELAADKNILHKAGDEQIEK